MLEQTTQNSSPSLRLFRPTLTAAGGALQRTLANHASSVTTVALTPDGKQVISGSDDQTIKIWHLETGEELKTLKGHTDWVRTVAVTPDGTRIISGSDDQTIKIWNLETGEELKTLKGHADWVRTATVTPTVRG